MKKTVEVVAMAFATLVAGSAGATMWTSFSGVSDEGTEYTITASDGTKVLVRAYSTTTLGSQSGNFNSLADVKVFPGTEGFGINNKQGVDAGEASFPEWGVDNKDLYDLLVFELPKAGMTLEKLSLGWAEAGSDISVFFGGNGLGSGYNFSNTCFTGCTTGSSLSALGFTQVNHSNVAVNTELTPGNPNTGRYVAISGSLVTSPGDDKFKVNMIKASGGVPTPGTLALLGLGLVGMGSLRRRQAVTA